MKISNRKIALTIAPKNVFLIVFDTFLVAKSKIGF